MKHEGGLVCGKETECCAVEVAWRKQAAFG